MRARRAPRIVNFRLMSVLKWRASRRTSDIEARIRAALEGLAPLLPVSSGGVELVRFEPESGRAVVRARGDCPDCELSVEMLMQGIAAHVRRHVPEVREVEPVPGGCARNE